MPCCGDRINMSSDNIKTDDLFTADIIWCNNSRTTISFSISTVYHIFIAQLLFYVKNTMDNKGDKYRINLTTLLEKQYKK